MAKKITERKENSLPSISVCIPTYNSGKTIERCLKIIRNQDYPQDKVEILLGDGGSTDNTINIAKKYNARVIVVSSEKQHAEYNRGVAFNEATGEFALIIDHDNFLISNMWLRQMVFPLVSDSEIIASTTCYYHYDKKQAVLDRYFALLGTSEPLPYYLHKSDRMPQYQKEWSLVGKSKDCGTYFKVQFEHNARKFPSVGSNGTLMRRKLVLKYAKADPDNHYPIDVMFDMACKGFDKFAFVKNSILHLTHSQGVLAFLKRRIRFVNKYHFEEQSKRRWSVFVKGDELNLILFVLYSVTFIKPTYDALVGYLKIRDIAWFVHPIMCIGTTFVYSYSTIAQLLRRKDISV